MPAAWRLDSLQLPAEASWTTDPLPPQPTQQFADEPNPRRQKVHCKLEIQQLAPYQGKEGMEGGLKGKDLTPNGTHSHFPAVTLVVLQRNGNFSPRSGGRTAHSDRRAAVELEDCEGSHEEHPSTTLTAKGRGSNFNYTLPLYLEPFPVYLRDFPYA